jgi:hypothetical protein
MTNAKQQGLLVLAVLVFVGVLAVGCTQLGTWGLKDESSDKTISLTSTEKALPQILPTAGRAASCGLIQLTGEERETAIQAALADPKVQSLIPELQSRGFTVMPSAALAFGLDGEKLVYLPAGPGAGIVYETYLGKGYAVAAIQEGEKTINLRPDQGVRHITGFDPKTRDKLFKQVRKHKQLKALEKALKSGNQRIDWSESVLFVDTDRGSATIGLAVKETNSAKRAWFGYRVSATLKGRKLAVQSVKAEECRGLASQEIGLTTPTSIKSSNQLVPDIEPIGDGVTVTYVNNTVCTTSPLHLLCLPNRLENPQPKLELFYDITQYPLEGESVDFSVDKTIEVTNAVNALKSGATDGSGVFARDKVRNLNIAMLGYSKLTYAQIQDAMNLADQLRSSTGITNQTGSPALPPQYRPVCSATITTNCVTAEEARNAYLNAIKPGGIVDQLAARANQFIFHVRPSDIKSAWAKAISNASNFFTNGGRVALQIQWNGATLFNNMSSYGAGIGNNILLSQVLTDILNYFTQMGATTSVTVFLDASATLEVAARATSAQPSLTGDPDNPDNRPWVLLALKADVTFGGQPTAILFRSGNVINGIQVGDIFGFATTMTDKPNYTEGDANNTITRVMNWLQKVDDWLSKNNISEYLNNRGIKIGQFNGIIVAGIYFPDAIYTDLNPLITALLNSRFANGLRGGTVPFFLVNGNGQIFCFGCGSDLRKIAAVAAAACHWYGVCTGNVYVCSVEPVRVSPAGRAKPQAALLTCFPG